MTLFDTAQIMRLAAGLGVAAALAIIPYQAGGQASPDGSAFPPTAALPEQAPPGHLIEGRYAEDLIIRVVPVEALAQKRDAGRTGIF